MSLQDARLAIYRWENPKTSQSQPGRAEHFGLWRIRSRTFAPPFLGRFRSSRTICGLFQTSPLSRASMNSIAFSPSGETLNSAVEPIQFQGSPHQKFIRFAVFHEPDLKGFRVENRQSRVSVIRCFFHGSNPPMLQPEALIDPLRRPFFHTNRLTGHTFPLCTNKRFGDAKRAYGCRAICTEKRETLAWTPPHPRAPTLRSLGAAKSATGLLNAKQWPL